MHKMKRFLSIVLTVCMLVSILSTGVFAVSISTKPENGTTEGQPFAPGTGGSQNFRIPGIVTLNDGTLVAVCDARWNHSADSSGLDTIVSVSKDNGATWEYTFANYLGDNGDVYNSYSSCIIDPAIATDGETIYLIADLFPAGMAINTSAYRAQRGSTGYTAEGYLALRSDEENGLTFGQSSYDTYAASATYGYYLKDGKIYTNDGAEVEGYSVDAYFNITGNGVNTNLFFGDSPYKPFPTDYLYMTTSKDGLTWSEPTLINLKAADEQTLLIGPGNGTYDPESGRMIFTAYEYDWGTQNACLVWRETDGTWHRSENAASSSHWTSEATSVVLDDGTVRIFYRDGYTNLFYSDYVYSEASGNYVVANREVSTTAVKASNNQLTSIRYSKPVNGKDAILVACSGSGSGSRVNGYLYVFTLNEDNTMDLAYAYDIIPDQDEAYAYNCISEMNDGNIALLYESAGAAITFHVIDMEEVLDRENDPSLTFKAFELLTGESKSFTDNSGYYGDDDISELDTSVAELTMTGEEIVTDAAQLGSNSSYSGDTVSLADCLYTFTKGENDRWSAAALDGTVYLYPGNTTSSGYPNRDTEYADLSIYEGYEEGTFAIMSNHCDNGNQNTSYLYFDRSGLRWDRVSAYNGNTTWMTNCSLMLYKPVEGDGSAEIPGYERITSMDELTDGEYLVVGPGADGNLYALYPNTSTDNRYCQLAKLLGRTTVGYTELTFTGVGAGYTEVQVGSTVYQVTVADVTEVTLEIPVGTSVTVTEANGNYSDADTSELDGSIATVTMTGVDGTAANGLSTAPVSELTDGTYVIINTRANKLVTNAAATAAAEAGAGSGLFLNGSKSGEIAADAVWTITEVEGGYTIQDANGQFMTISSNNASVTDASATLDLNWRGSTWTIAQNGAYLNHFGGGTSTCAAGWQSTSAAGDEGSQFAIYAYSAEPYSASTELTFTGVYPGATELLIGRTRYVITVTGDVHDVQLQVGESKSYIIAGELTEADLAGLDTSIVTAELSNATVAHVSNGTSYNAEAVSLADCLYTFTATDDGCYEVTATTADGTTVYLNHFSSGNNNPSITSPAGKIAVQTSSHENMFKLVAQVVSVGSGSSRGLHFHSEAAMPYWNRCGNDTSAKCHEYLYRPVREGEESSAEIKGYVLVTDIAEIVDGGQYLIVHNDDLGALYVLHPSASTENKWEHVAKLAPATELTFTGVAKGETALTVPGNVFEIAVSAGHEHSYEAVVTAPTCTEGGYTTYTCECGDTYVADETEALGHTEEIIPGVEPTYEAPGLTEGVKCSVCGEILTAQVEIPALNYNDRIIPVEVLTATAGDEEPNGLQYGEGPASFVLDDDTATLWHTNWYGTSRENHWIQFELSDSYLVDGLLYQPRQSGNDNGTITEYEILVSNDGENFTSVATGNWEVDREWKFASFNGEQVKYVRLVAVDAYTDNAYVFASAAEIRLTGEKVQDHEHSYTAVVTDPTCTEGGYTTYTCECGDSYIADETEALGHSYEAVVTDPTCTEGGYTTYTCSVCGDSYTADETDALGHTEEVLPGTEATYDNAGLTEGVKCSVCGEILTAQEEIPMLDYNDGIVPVEYLNATTGDYQTGYETTEGPAALVLDNDYSTKWHTNWYGTSRENHWIQFELTEWYAVNGLRYKPRTDLNRQGEPQLNGTITEYKILISNDGVNFEEITTGTWDANQNWKTVEFDAVTAKYIRLVAVDACTDNDYVFASASEIRLVGVETEAPACLHTNTEIRDAKAATCTEDGYTGDTYCADCGEKLADGETIAATGHTAGEAVVENEKPATCTENGSYDSVVYCSECGVEMSRETVTVEALGHDYVAVVTAPTCTEGGYTTYTCSRCGDSYVADETAALGHTAGEAVKENVVDATCTEDGSYESVVYCSVCGAELSRETVTVPASCASSVYTDVPVGDWYHEAVDFVTAEGIMNGMTGTTFEPGTNTNRAMMAVLLYRLAGSPSVEGLTEPFTDVESGQWFYDAVVWAYNEGIVNGVTADTFAPGLSITRAQMVTMMYRYAGSPTVDASVLEGFADAGELGYSADAFAWAIAEGVVTGMTANTLAPNGTANRAQIAVILYRYLSK